MRWVLHSRQPTCRGHFSIHQGTRTKLKRSIGNRKCTEVHHCSSLVPLSLPIFDLTKAKSVSDLYSTEQTPLTFPGWLKHSRGADGVKGGYAAAKRSRTLDTALSASAHNPNIRGMSVFLLPAAERQSISKSNAEAGEAECR
jgi:hypothetical protein